MGIGSLVAYMHRTKEWIELPMRSPITPSLFCNIRIGAEAFLIHPGGSIPEGLRESLADPSGLPCVLIHAFPLDSRMWEPTIDFLAAEGHFPIAFDLPGFGMSKRRFEAGEALSITDAADEILSCLDSLGITRAVLIGCSMGGYVIFSMIRARSRLAAGLLLADTRAGADSEEARAARQKAIETIKSGGRRSFLDSMRERLLAQREGHMHDAVSARVAEIMDAQEDETLIAALRGLAERPDSTDLLPSLDVPTTVVVGEEDAILPIEEARALADAIPGAVLEVIPGAGHLPSLEAPESFNLALRALLGRVRKEAPAG